MGATDPEDINKIISRYRKETRAIFDHIHQLCWYMRGGITREEAWELSHEERVSVMALIDENIERVNKTKIPIL